VTRPPLLGAILAQMVTILTHRPVQRRDMSDVLKPGDRVRVKAGVQIPHYPAGEKGTVARGPQTSADGTTYYLLVMDKDAAAKTVLFKTDEIEPDV
jgi:hypothetical protein